MTRLTRRSAQVRDYFDETEMKEISERYHPRMAMKGLTLRYTHLLLVILILLMFVANQIIHLPSQPSKTLPFDEITTAESETITASQIDPFLLQMQLEGISLKGTNSTQYTWVGNHWIPPVGVPAFLPSQIVTYFQKRNVLFIGDSTMRRAYATLYAVMDSYENSVTNSSDVIHHVDLAAVDAANVTNVGKDKNVPWKSEDRQCMQKDRFLGRKRIADHSLCRNVPGSEKQMDLESSYTLGNQAWSNSRKGKFDYVRVDCYNQLSWHLRMDADNDVLPQIKEDYDLIVIGLGIWEVTYPNYNFCRGDSDLVRDERLVRVLETITNVTSSKLQAAFRTTGHNGKKTFPGGGSHELNELTRTFFLSAQNDTAIDSPTPSHNMTLIDWGAAIHHRSFGEERIEGDHVNHYGLEARLLFIQQLLHELIRVEYYHS